MVGNRKKKNKHSPEHSRKMAKAETLEMGSTPIADWVLSAVSSK